MSRLHDNRRSLCLLVHLPQQLRSLNGIHLAHIRPIKPPQHLKLLVMMLPVLIDELERLRKMVHFGRVSLFNDDLDNILA